MRPFHAVVIVLALSAAACGTRSVDVADPAELVAAQVATTSSSVVPTTRAVSTAAPSTSSSTSTTTTSSTTTSTSTSTTTSTTTTAAPLPTYLLDDHGSLRNGQSEGVLRTDTGWIVPVLDVVAGGWNVWTPCGRVAEVSHGSFVDRVDFVIDPGHGGSEPGAVGPGGTREADINVQVARRVVAALEGDGYRVVMTRDRDVRLPIATRAEIALALDPIAFISIHHNAGTEAVSAEPGTEMFFQLASADSKRLAGLLYEETREVLDPLGSSWFALSDAGAMSRANREGGDYYGVLRRPAGVTSVIAEFAYITNPVEEDLLNRADVQDQLADAVRAAVARFTATDDPGSGFTENPIFRGYGPSGAGGTGGCTDPALQ